MGGQSLADDIGPALQEIDEGRAAGAAQIAGDGVE